MDNLTLKGSFENKSGHISVLLDMYLFKEEVAIIIYCPALDLSAFGYSEEEAKSAFEQSLDVYFDYCVKKNTLVQDLRAHGWNVKSKNQHKVQAPLLERMLEINPTLIDITLNKPFTKHNRTVEIPAAS